MTRLNRDVFEASGQVPIQDDWRHMSIGHRLWDIDDMFDGITSRSARKGWFERACDKVRYRWFHDLDCIWPSFKQGVRNLRYWAKVMWQDRDWDQTYLDTIMKAKLRKILAYRNDPNSNYHAHVGDDKVEHDILEMIMLLDRVYEDRYMVHNDLTRKTHQWHMPFADLQINHFTKSHEYETYMRRQDVDRFCMLLAKNHGKLWD